MQISYVNVVVIDAAGEFVVGLTKKTGPAQLLGRITYPGGKIDPGETVQEAATRELREETGLVVAADAWLVIDYYESPTTKLTTLTAKLPSVHAARTMTHEPVWVLSIAHHENYAAAQPASYTRTFVAILRTALERMGLRQSERLAA